MNANAEHRTSNAERRTRRARSLFGVRRWTFDVRRSPFLLLFILASIANAQATRPTLTASLGFDGLFKPDNPTPVFVTLADPDRRAGTLELRVAHNRLGTETVARVVANPLPQTFTLYAALGLLDRAQVQFRDASGKLVAKQDLTDAIAQTPAAFGSLSVGVSGEVASARRVVGSLSRDSGEYVSTGLLDTPLLPERAIGYRAIDVLAIAGLDTDALDDRVERAIADWVAGGGILIAWPGTQRPTRGGPLADLLPADLGEMRETQVDGRPLIVRALVPRSGVADLSNGETFRRRVGLGQIVLTSVDPTLLGDPARRIARWRMMTENECSFSADDRRAGVFDPLIAQGVAEQSIESPAPGSTPWRSLAWVAFVAGLVLGPAEVALLVATGRPPWTAFTLVGIGLCVAGGAGLLASPRSPSLPDARVEVLVEDDAGTAIARAVASRELTADFTSLAGEAADPARQPAGAIGVAQHGESFAPRWRWQPADARRPIVRSIAYRPADATTRPATRAAFDAIVTRSAATTDHEMIADDPNTKRVETGLERLAREPAFAGLMLDRTIAARLVRILETEDRAELKITREAFAGDTRFVVRVVRLSAGL